MLMVEGNYPELAAYVLRKRIDKLSAPSYKKWQEAVIFAWENLPHPFMISESDKTVQEYQKKSDRSLFKIMKALIPSRSESV